MFINLKTGKPAWLLAHDSDVTFTHAHPSEDKPRHTVPGHEFFQQHREATRDEVDEHTPAQPTAPAGLVGSEVIDLQAVIAEAKEATRKANEAAQAAQAATAAATSASSGGRRN